MKEITITTNKMNPLVDPGLSIWGLDVSIDLFLGGLTAGILVIAALMVLRGKGERFNFAANRMILLAPILLSVAMFFLWMDLENKLKAWRFYMTFRITSPMSWGSWVLLLVYPLSFLMILSTFRQGYEKVYAWLETKLRSFSFTGKHMGKFYKVFDFCEKHRPVIAKLTVPVGVLLGLYTGILLSAFSARPFWNTALMGPLFLVSGLTTAAALIILFSREPGERHFFSRVTLGLIFVKLSLLILFIIGMLTSSRQHSKAIQLILGGPMTAYFWVFIIGIGLLLPVFLVVSELKSKESPGSLGTIAASLVLTGGFIMRVVIVKAGQISTWITY
jgi:formate-dependent nitrite reductase membrane component NrfD